MMVGNWKMRGSIDYSTADFNLNIYIFYFKSSFENEQIDMMAAWLIGWENPPCRYCWVEIRIVNNGAQFYRNPEIKDFTEI